MASRRPTNGRSPLVNPQRQITSFFSKSPSSTPSPSPATPHLLPTSTSNPNTSPTTPSSLHTKRTNKPALVADQSQNPIFGDEVVNRRIRVYWPLDKAWYEGRVKSFHTTSGKHLVLYDDDQEELLDLSKEKIDFFKDHKKRFRRLRRISIQDDDAIADDGVGDADKNVVESGGDDSADEDWGMKQVSDHGMEDLDLLEEDDQYTRAMKPDLKKRKRPGMKSDFAKQIKNEAPVDLSPRKLERTHNNNRKYEYY